MIQDPANAVNMLQEQVGAVGRLTGHALGLNGDEVDLVAENGIPVPLLMVSAFALGAVISLRYAPDSWIGKVRDFGK